MIDFIGDIHGHADKLIALLSELGYTYKNETYSNPNRKVLFVGDYIDRGPYIKETLAIVKRMVETGNADALMGNHEYNALCYHSKKSEDEFLRKHSPEHNKQHQETLDQFESEPHLWQKYLEWFKTLPLFIEKDQFRAVHACWDTDNINYLRTVLQDGKLSSDLIYESAQKGTALYHAVEEVLKGKEIKLPGGRQFQDKDGQMRSETRTKWWINPLGKTYNQISVIPIDDLGETLFVPDSSQNNNYYLEKEIPVFFGHYWLNGKLEIRRDNVCCLDYSVAREGLLVAYKFDGGKILSNDKLVFV